MAHRNRIGVRELRQNLSVYLRRVKAGESLEVTERGQPVARLAPLEDRRDPRTRLIGEGKLIPGRGDLAEIGPPIPAEDRSLGGELDAVREDIA
jgi:prevent-host-death family protein